jgi:hypothetical protein
MRSFDQELSGQANFVFLLTLLFDSRRGCAPLYIALLHVVLCT